MWKAARSVALWISRTMPWTTGLVPKGLRDLLRSYIGVVQFSNLPDRRYMEEAILPAFAARQPRRLLLVGTEYYTRHYPHAFAKAGTEIWTVDIEPQVAQFGVASRHIVGDVRDVSRHFPTGHFDAVMMNGILGYGLDSVEAATSAILACRAVLRDCGALLLGWDTNHFDDPLEQIKELHTHFRPADWPELPRRKTFDQSPHVYDILVARRDSASGTA